MAQHVVHQILAPLVNIPPKKTIESSGMDQNRVKTWDPRDPPCFGGMKIWMRAGKGFLIHSHLEAVEIVSHCLILLEPCLGYG